MPKAGFISLGCPKNLVDSEVMMGILARNGYEFTPRAEEADVLVVNTCSFIAPAQKESIDTILEMAEYKKFGVAKKLIVAGCLVERYREQILEQIPEVDAVVGTGEVENILAAVEGELRFDAGTAAALPSYLYHDLTPRILSTPRHAAYIKIAEGCDHPCTFCIIPQLRGKFRSRRFESVVREAENLASAGVREVTLIGQDTTSYGEDLGLRDGLALLLERLAGVEGLHWVRFLYCYPNRVTQRLLDTIAQHPRLAKYMDMPLQHASRNVLARMKRGSSGKAFLQLLRRIQRNDSGRVAANFIHRRIPRRNRGGFPRTVRLRRSRGIRLDGRLPVLGRRQCVELRARRKGRRRHNQGTSESPDGNSAENLGAQAAAVPRPALESSGRRPVQRYAAGLGSAA